MRICNLKIVSGILFLWFATTLSVAQSTLTPDQFLQVKEIFKIVNAAKKAGFSDKEIDRLLLVDDSRRQVSITAVLQAYEIAKADRRLPLSRNRLDLSQSEINLVDFLKQLTTEKKVVSSRRFLSAQDVRRELNRSQKSVLNALVAEMQDDE